MKEDPMNVMRMKEEPRNIKPRKNKSVKEESDAESEKSESDAFILRFLCWVPKFGNITKQFNFYESSTLKLETRIIP